MFSYYISNKYMRYRPKILEFCKLDALLVTNHIFKIECKTWQK